MKQIVKNIVITTVLILSTTLQVAVAGPILAPQELSAVEELSTAGGGESSVGLDSPIDSCAIPPGYEDIASGNGVYSNFVSGSGDNRECVKGCNTNLRHCAESAKRKLSKMSCAVGYAACLGVCGVIVCWKDVLEQFD